MFTQKNMLACMNFKMENDRVGIEITPEIKNSILKIVEKNIGPIAKEVRNVIKITKKDFFKAYKYRKAIYYKEAIKLRPESLKEVIVVFDLSFDYSGKITYTTETMMEKVRSIEVVLIDNRSLPESHCCYGGEKNLFTTLENAEDFLNMYGDVNKEISYYKDRMQIERI